MLFFKKKKRKKEMVNMDKDSQLCNIVGKKNSTG